MIVRPRPAPPIIELRDEDVEDVENDVIELVSIKRVDIARPPPTFVIASVMHDEATTREDSTPDLAHDYFETNILRRGHIKRRLIALGLMAAVVLACPWAANITRESRAPAVAVNAVGAKIAPLAKAATPAKTVAPAKNNVKVAPPKPRPTK